MILFTRIQFQPSQAKETQVSGWQLRELTSRTPSCQWDLPRKRGSHNIGSKQQKPHAPSFPQTQLDSRRTSEHRCSSRSLEFPFMSGGCRGLAHGTNRPGVRRHDLSSPRPQQAALAFPPRDFSEFDSLLQLRVAFDCVCRPAGDFVGCYTAGLMNLAYRR